jgi:hypothetical protein
MLTCSNAYPSLVPTDMFASMLLDVSQGVLLNNKALLRCPVRCVVLLDIQARCTILTERMGKTDNQACLISKVDTANFLFG